MVLRSAVDPNTRIDAVRAAVKKVDPNLPIAAVATQAEQIERRFAQEKLFAMAYSWFGGLALVIAAVGLFGLMSYSVSRRTNEIGVRMALGADRGDVSRMVLRESMQLVAIGVVLGGIGALAASSLVERTLYGVPPRDASRGGTPFSFFEPENWRQAPRWPQVQAPMATSCMDSRRWMRDTSPRSAPSAMRTPIFALLRRDTLWDIKPNRDPLRR